VTINPVLRIATAVPGDIDVMRRLFRRSSLSNEGDRAKLLANPDVLELSDRCVRARDAHGSPSAATAASSGSPPRSSSEMPSSWRISSSILIG
jgi:hypothetical protein